MKHRFLNNLIFVLRKVRDRSFVNIISLIHCVLKVASAYLFVVLVP